MEVMHSKVLHFSFDFQGSAFSEKLENKIAHMQTILPIFSVFCL